MSGELQRLRQKFGAISENALLDQPAKPAKAPFAGFAGTPAGSFSQNQGDTGEGARVKWIAWCPPITVDMVREHQAAIAKYVRALQPLEGWSDEQCDRIIAASYHQPACSLSEDAVLLARQLERMEAHDHISCGGKRAERCCARCANRAPGVTVLGAICIVVRWHLDDPWRDWLDAEDQPNDCAYYEEKS